MNSIKAILACVAALGAAVLLLAQPARAASDIYSYKTPDNTWSLRQERDSVSTKNWTKLQSGPCEAAVGYYSASRTLQFGGKNAKARVWLIFADDMLVGFCFDISAGQRSYSSLRSYYAERYGSLQSFDVTDDSVTWMDEDGDTLSVLASERSDGSACTLIGYISDDLYSKMDVTQIPGWMESSIADL